MQYKLLLELSLGQIRKHEMIRDHVGKSVSVDELSEVLFDFSRVDGAPVTEDVSLFVGGKKLDLVYDSLARKSLRSQVDRYFLHSLGVVEISLIVDDVNILLPNVIVRTSKASKSAVRYMYSVLSRPEYDSFWERNVSVSSYDAVSSSGSNDIVSMLSLSESLIEDCEILFYKNNSLVLTKLEKKNKISKFSDATYVGDAGVHWLLSNLDVLINSAPEDAVISYSGKNFKPVTIQVDANDKTFQIYENESIASELYSVISKLKSLSSHSCDDKREDEDFVLGELFIHKHRINKIVSRCEKLLCFIEREFDIKPSRRGVTLYTDRFRFSPIYRKIYNDIHRWNNLRDFSRNGFEFYRPVISATKIFEYYCLFRIRSSIVSSGWDEVNNVDENQLLEPINLRVSNPDISSFLFKSKDGDYLHVFYEPKILKNPSRVIGRNLYYTKLSAGSSFCHPDFVIVRYKSCKITSVGILDAKFSNKEIVRGESLPSLINQYYVNIVSDDTQTPLSYIYAIYPSADAKNSEMSGFRSSGFNLNEAMECETKMGAIGIDFAKGAESEFSCLLSDIIFD